MKLNERRVEEEELKSELGLGNILDSVDAQNALTAAQTSLTGSLVRQRIALLEFWRDLHGGYLVMFPPEQKTRNVYVLELLVQMVLGCRRFRESNET